LKKRLLLISNSKLFGLGYLDHAEKHILDFLGPLSASSFVLFVPYAQKDHDAYAQKARERFAAFGVSLRSIHEFTSAAARREGVESAACLFVGGGNSFRLLKSMQSDPALMPLIRSRVNSGALKYIGSSAGTNLACPTIRNTNDMPIVQPATLAALCLIPFQINTHYIDREREVAHHMGETRELRLTEFLEENRIPLVALREGAAIFVDGETARLIGPAKKSKEITWDGALVRSRAAGARELANGDELSFLMAPPADGSVVAADVDTGNWVAKLFDDEESAPAQSATGFSNG
jgi:dipeptidase E